MAAYKRSRSGHDGVGAIHCPCSANQYLRKRREPSQLDGKPRSSKQGVESTARVQGLLDGITDESRKRSDGTKSEIRIKG